MGLQGRTEAVTEYAPAVFDPAVVCELVGAPNNPWPDRHWRRSALEHGYAENNGKSLCGKQVRYVAADSFNPIALTRPCRKCTRELASRLAQDLNDLKETA